MQKDNYTSKVWAMHQMDRKFSEAMSQMDY